MVSLINVPLLFFSFIFPPILSFHLFCSFFSLLFGPFFSFWVPAKKKALIQIFDFFFFPFLPTQTPGSCLLSPKWKCFPATASPPRPANLPPPLPPNFKHNPIPYNHGSPAPRLPLCNRKQLNSNSKTVLWPGPSWKKKWYSNKDGNEKKKKRWEIRKEENVLKLRRRKTWKKWKNELQRWKKGKLVIKVEQKKKLKKGKFETWGGEEAGQTDIWIVYTT